ncbi:hypothetical protein IFM89_018104 [Coptis chinensis]|uniref:Uncharacterized protein n=1 Tax=Coptis chinensis TaxID=261450 RepID=A0A835M8A1_9MAGN|nr:hypothetical protein IFM89_018104 [Coptis chinensis]
MNKIENRQEELEMGEGRSITEIKTSLEKLDGAVIYHVVKDLIGFILYMHQQIPSILQDLSDEFHALQIERKDLELISTQSEVKASSRRNQIGRMREVKQGLKRMEKLMNTLASLNTAIQLMLNESHNIEGVMLVLGSSPIRPQQVYEMFFSHGSFVAEHTIDYNKSKAAETLSRKAIRALVSDGAGSVSYAGPTKLFLLAKAPATFNLPLHFLPKRDFRYSKKIVPFKLCIKCKVREQDMDTSECCASSSSIGLPVATSNDSIWYVTAASITCFCITLYN